MGRDRPVTHASQFKAAKNGAWLAKISRFVAAFQAKPQRRTPAFARPRKKPQVRELLFANRICLYSPGRRGSPEVPPQTSII